MKKFIFYTVSAALWLACFALVIVVWLEHLGGYSVANSLIRSKPPSFQLHESSYYGKPLPSNPYNPTDIQYLHPFYLFSLPWTPRAIAHVSNATVTLNSWGFRRSLKNGAQRKGVILGGSTAFGSHATTNDFTLASALNRVQQNYEFYNFGVPSWNSHQEMVAFTKLPFKPGYVIAFTGSNDFTIALRYCSYGKDYPPATPESFGYLADITDDIRGTKNLNLYSNFFPDTKRKLKKLFAAATPDTFVNDCKSRILDAARAFLANQSVVRDLAVARGAGFLLVLQPHLHFLQNRQTQEHSLRKMFYETVMRSSLCKESACVDLSRSFEGVSPLEIEEVREEPNKAIFTDRVHLTDNGFSRVADLLVNLIEQDPANGDAGD